MQDLGAAVPKGRQRKIYSGSAPGCHSAAGWPADAAGGLRSAAIGWRLVASPAADTPELVETSPDNLRAVVKAAADDGVDFIVIDTRPSVERDTAEVARVADFALIPTRPSILDLRAIGATVDVVKALERRAAIILNACPAGRGVGEASVTTEARRGLRLRAAAGTAGYHAQGLRWPRTDRRSGGD